MHQPGQQIAQRYELTAPISEASGELWRAIDARSARRQVFVRVSPIVESEGAGVGAQFDATCNAVSRLSHPNVVPIVGHGLDGGYRYVAYDVGDGELLSALIARARSAATPPDLASMKRIFEQVCAGVEAAHDVAFPAAILHQGLDPTGVFVTHGPQGPAARVFDFGVALRSANPRYAAPEVMTGQTASVGAASDVFSLAVMFIELVSLRSTSVGDDTWWATTMRSGGELSAILETLRAEVPPVVWNVIERALHPSTSQRLPSAGMLRAALRGAWEAAGTPAIPTTVAMPARSNAGPVVTATAAPWPKQPVAAPFVGRTPAADSSFTVIVMASLFVLLVVACGAWVALRTRRPPPAPRPVARTPYVPYVPPPPRPRPPRPSPVDNRVYFVPENPSAPARGPRSAPVKLVVFSDFQCPFCGRIGPTFDRLRETYGDRLRIEWRNQPLPFHTRAMPAAEAAKEVQAQLGDEGFWRYHDLLFANRTGLSDDNLAALAEQVGANPSRVRAALVSHRHRAAIGVDQDAYRAIGTHGGTPSSFINGRMVRGAAPYERFAAAIDRALAEAGSFRR